MNRLLLPVLVIGTLVAPTPDSVTGPAGVYTVTTSGPTTVTSGPGWVKIEWEPAIVPDKPTKPVDPPPPPPPGPTTTDAEVPTLTGPVWIAAVYDKATVSSLPKGQQDLLASKTISAALKGLDITWSSWAKDDPGLKDWGPDAGSTYPVFLVIWAGGTKSKTFPCPPDESAAVAFGKKLRGQ